MKTGIVMEIENGVAVVLRNGGDFARLSAQTGWQAGDVVPLAPPLEVAEKKKPLRLSRALLAVAACLVVLVAAGFGLRGYFAPTSLISIDVNPSIELSLNRFGRVVGAVGYSPESDALLAGVPVRGEGYQQALEKLLASAGMQKYLAGDALVAFSAYSSVDEEALLAYLDTLAASLGQAYPEGEFVCGGVGHGEVEEAHGHGISAGKLQAIRELQALDPAAEIDDWKHRPMREIRQRINELLGVENPAAGQGDGSGGVQGQGHGAGGGQGDGSGQDNGGGQGHGHGGGSRPG